jgi:hypothetical protein
MYFDEEAITSCYRADTLSSQPQRSAAGNSDWLFLVNYYYQWRILKPSGHKKAKKNFTVFVKTPNGTGENDTLKDTIGMA